MTPKEQLRSAVRRLIRAEIARAQAGGKDPFDIVAIVREQKDAKLAYDSLMKELTIT